MLYSPPCPVFTSSSLSSGCRQARHRLSPTARAATPRLGRSALFYTHLLHITFFPLSSFHLLLFLLRLPPSAPPFISYCPSSLPSPRTLRPILHTPLTCCPPLSCFHLLLFLLRLPPSAPPFISYCPSSHPSPRTLRPRQPQKSQIPQGSGVAQMRIPQGRGVAQQIPAGCRWSSSATLASAGRRARRARSRSTTTRTTTSRAAPAPAVAAPHGSLAAGRRNAPSLFGRRRLAFTRYCHHQYIHTYIVYSYTYIYRPWVNPTHILNTHTHTHTHKYIYI